jgi:signal transduction histidine kinase
MNRSQTIRASWSSWMSQSFEPVGPAWWQWLWTLLFAMLVAAGFTVIGFALFASGSTAWRNLTGWAQWYLNYLIVSLAIGYSIQGLFGLSRRVLGKARIRRFSRWQRTAYFIAIPLAGLALGMAIGMPLVRGNVGAWDWPSDANGIFASVLLSLLVFVLFQVYFSTRHRRIAAERQAAEAQLRLLQAQMEPHFLFNTLANVVGLMETDTPRAKAMLESFTDYLRASLLSLRAPEHSLGDELDLIEAYLRVVKVRMDDRLRYRIEVPGELRALRVPALSVQPLVENAVLHGLEPSIAGGEVVLGARLEAGRLVLRVSDDGIGLANTPRSPRTGSGTALNNIRARLAQVHGDLARLQIDAAEPHGVIATLTLPTGSTA